MLFEAKRFFVLSEIFTKLMTLHQIAMNQQFQGIINRSSTHPITLIFHVDIERFGVKMIRSVINFL